MTVQKTSDGLDFEALRQAIENLDAELLVSLYADDAENEVVGAERVAFNEACEYPDGTKVLCAATLEVQEGKIYRQVNVEAWDE
jgi:hypothetical protein